MDKHSALFYLLGSETRAKLLDALFINQGKGLSLSDLSSFAQVDSGGAYRELCNLKITGFAITTGEKGNHRYFINEKSPFFEGLREIFRKSSLHQAFQHLEEFPTVNMLCVFCHADVMLVNKMLEGKGIKSRLKRNLFIFDKETALAYVETSGSNEVCQEVFGKLLAQPSFGTTDCEEIISMSNQLLKVSDEIERKNFANASNEQLADFFEHYYLGTYQPLHTQGRIQNSVDSPEMLFSSFLLKLLKERSTGKKTNPARAFSKLTAPLEPSFMQKEYEDRIKIMRRISANHKAAELFKTTEAKHIVREIQGTPIGEAIAEHTHNYGWLGYGYTGPNWTQEHFIKQITDLLRQDPEADSLLAEEEKKRSETRRTQQEISREYGLTDYERGLFAAARGFVYAKAYRKDAMFKFFSCTEHFFEEIAKRRYASVTDVRYCMPTEVRAFLEGTLDLEELQKRREHSVWETTDEGEKFYYGNEANAFIKTLSFTRENTRQTNEINGMCACPGRAKGHVKIINKPDEIHKMTKGDVLVSIATTPDIVTAMKQASAIITDMGGMTCHAAIVSRELNIPCVVGTKNATKTLKDGMLVDIDATHGLVKIIG